MEHMYVDALIVNFTRADQETSHSTRCGALPKKG